MPRLILNPEKYVEHFARVVDQEPEIAFRILLVRNMIDQRGIQTNDLVALTGYSKNWMQATLTYASVRTEGYVDGRTHSVEAMNLRLDKIEEAITAWTSERGGVYSVTGSTAQGAEEFLHQASPEYQLARQEAGGRIL